MVKFKNAIDTVLDEGKWLHVFPEGSMWFYYPDIRPLKPAVFKFAVEHNKPVVPFVFTYRKRTGLWKLFGKNPLVNLHVGEPILPDLTLDKKEAIDKLHKEAYHIMQVMAGINPDDPTYNTNQNIDEYKKTM
jgi:1-acyl-sn-glycerol-3-phosphate acyltransferase